MLVEERLRFEFLKIAEGRVGRVRISLVQPRQLKLI